MQYIAQQKVVIVTGLDISVADHKKIEGFTRGLLISGDIRGICEAPRHCSLTLVCFIKGCVDAGGHKLD